MEPLTPEQAKKQGYLPLEEASQLPGAPDRTTLWRQCRNRKLPCVEVRKGSRTVFWVLESALTSKSREKTYEHLLDAWLTAMKNGSFTGRPLSQAYIDSLRWGLRYYWMALGVRPSIQDLNPENFSRVIATFRVDEVRRKDSYSEKCHIYKACTRFTDFLIQEGLKTTHEREEYRSRKPKRRFRPQRKVLPEQAVDEALRFNTDSWYVGRSQYTVALGDLLIALYYDLGLRRMEAASLRIQDVDFVTGLVLVFGKGSKERYVPMDLFPGVREKLERWLSSIRPKCRSDLLLVQADGKPLTKNLINTRFQRLTLALRVKKAYEEIPNKDGYDPKTLRRMAKELAKSYTHIDVKPHMLRRAFATRLANRGMPISMIQKLLGHEDIKTTQGYIQVGLADVLAWRDQHLAGVQPAIAEPTVQSTSNLLRSLLQRN